MSYCESKFSLRLSKRQVYMSVNIDISFICINVVDACISENLAPGSVFFRVLYIYYVRIILVETADSKPQLTVIGKSPDK